MQDWVLLIKQVLQYSLKMVFLARILIYNVLQSQKIHVTALQDMPLIIRQLSAETWRRVCFMLQVVCDALSLTSAGKLRTVGDGTCWVMLVYRRRHWSKAKRDSKNQFSCVTPGQDVATVKPKAVCVCSPLLAQKPKLQPRFLNVSTCANMKREKDHILPQYQLDFKTDLCYSFLARAQQNKQ